VAYADLALGAHVEPVLAAHVSAGAGRCTAIRNVGTWDDDIDVVGGLQISRPGLYRETHFRAGFALLERFHLNFDAWVYQTQLDDLIDLAQAFPRQPIVLNHSGGVLGVGRYAGRRGQLFAAWRSSMQRLAACPNVLVKLGGLGMKRCAFDFFGNAGAATSEAVANAWRPWLETCIEEFGAERCMFESNFPVDRASCSYRVLWNAFKRVVAGASASEKRAVLHDTAVGFYRIA
jgi:predicted TIM-barrel fold metal-dependent hydrolase